MLFQRLTILAFLTSTFAQTLPTSLFGINLSTQCTQSVIGAISNGSFAQCSHVSDLAPILTASNMSVIPYLDQFMSDVCYNQPCSNDTLTQAAQTVTAGCQADIANGTIGNNTIQTIFSLYPLIREVLCLKTSNPYTNASYNGTLGAPPVPISTLNSTGSAYFCVSSVLTQLSAYFQSNITIPYLTGIITKQNTTAVQLVQNIQPNILCNGCLFGAVDLIELVAPSVGDIPIASVFGALGISANITNSTTSNQAMNNTCAYVPLAVSTNGTLPTNISVAIVNSTFPVPIGNGTGSL